MADTPPLVTTEWLQEHLDDPGVRVVDMRGYVDDPARRAGRRGGGLPGGPRGIPRRAHPGRGLPRLDPDIVDPDDPVPAQIAPPERFAEAMAERGIGDATHVVAVDHMGGQFATRLWWALGITGTTRVCVLDGGWNRWVEEERPTEAGEVTVRPAVVHARVRARIGATTAERSSRPARAGPTVQIIDARDAGQYTGARRAGRAAGISRARSMSLASCSSPTGGGFLPLDEIRRRVEENGVHPDRPVIAYCNGGVAATVVLFNLFRLGLRDLTNYDGSWNEWGPARSAGRDVIEPGGSAHLAGSRRPPPAAVRAAWDDGIQKNRKK